MTDDINRMYNAGNPYQGTMKRVLCVCSAGLLRSPTAAWILSNNPYDFNTRAAGVESYALIEVDEVLVAWADEFVVMDKSKAEAIETFSSYRGQPIHVLDVPDSFAYKDAQLVALLSEKFKQIYNS